MKQLCGLAVGGLLASAFACTHVSAVHQPLQYLSTSQPIEVWVIRKHNDSTYRITQPRLQGDTLIGFALPGPGSPITQYQEIPLQDVRQMRAKQAAPVRTAALVGGLTGVVVFGYAELVGGSGNGARVPIGTPNFCECEIDDICGC